MPIDGERQEGCSEVRYGVQVSSHLGSKFAAYLVRGRPTHQCRGGRGDNLECPSTMDVCIARMSASMIFSPRRMSLRIVLFLLLERLVHNIKNRRLLSKNEAGCLP